MRTYGGLKPSAGTRIPPDMRLRVLTRDDGCVLFGRAPGDCQFANELDHVRGSGGMGMKSVTCDCNLVTACGAHHRWKTEHGREGREIELAYLDRFGYTTHSEGHLDHAHVDPVFGCGDCYPVPV